MQDAVHSQCFFHPSLYLSSGAKGGQNVLEGNREGKIGSGIPKVLQNGGNLIGKKFVTWRKQQEAGTSKEVVVVVVVVVVATLFREGNT